MSFLKENPLSGIGAGAAAANPNGAADALGHLIGVDPSTISSGAGKFGTAMNGIARAGGAEAGYQPAQPPNNYMQMMDPSVMRAIMAKFGPAQNSGMVR